ncbi:MAG: FAD-binding protein [Bacillota bacterium]
MKIYKADVLVIGTGLAGLMAAVNCKENYPDLKVLICSKAPPGLANCTAVSKGAFRNTSPKYHPEEFKEETLESGYYLNDQRLLDTLVNNSEKDLNLLESYGIKFEKRSRGRYIYRKSLDGEGTVITRAVLDYAQGLEVEFLYPFLAWDLIEKEGQAAGVWGFLKDSGNPAACLAKAVVLASGGAGAIYDRTDNPPGITGDGYALAYRAGLPLMDMEFVQFYPLGSASPGAKARFLLPILAEAGRFININGEDIVEKYEIDELPLASNSRDKLSRAMALEAADIREKEGTVKAVKLEFDFSPDSWQRAKGILGYTDIEPVKTWLKNYLGNRNYIPVMPVAHFFCGGLIIDHLCQTDLPGLFAAGEVVGGLHGADRLGSNALSEALVFGKIAGKQAGEFCTNQPSENPGRHFTSTLENRVNKETEKLFNNNTKNCGGNKESYREKRKRLGKEMMEKAGLIRSEELLKAVKETIINEQNYLVWNGKEKELRSFLELKNLYLVAELITDAARVRKESRGTHYRSDYPGLSGRYDRNIINSSYLKRC